MTQYKELYRVNQLPVFQNHMYRTQHEAQNCVMGDMLLVQDMATGLIFNQAFKPELMQYNAGYQNEQAFSTVFRAHLDQVTGIIERHFTGKTLIEVGCGKGYFLDHLRARSFKITGFDPTYEGMSSNIVKDLFTPAVGLNADGIILRHVLEHVQDPVGFLRHIAASNGGSGKIYIEVPCIEWIREHYAWFDIFYEHVNYFRLADFARIFGKTYEAGYIFGGQYLYVVADIGSLGKSLDSPPEGFAFPRDFTGSVSRFARLLKASRESSRTRRVIVWGGASKGVIFSLFMQRAGVVIDFVVDINPAKQGKFLAATGIRVSAPEEALDQIGLDSTVIAMNGNYLVEIREMTANKFNYLTVDHEV